MQSAQQFLSRLQHLLPARFRGRTRGKGGGGAGKGGIHHGGEHLCLADCLLQTGSGVGEGGVQGEALQALAADAGHRVQRCVVDDRSQGAVGALDGAARGGVLQTGGTGAAKQVVVQTLRKRGRQVREVKGSGISMSNKPLVECCTTASRWDRRRW